MLKCLGEAYDWSCNCSYRKFNVIFQVALKRDVAALRPKMDLLTALWCSSHGTAGLLFLSVCYSLLSYDTLLSVCFNNDSSSIEENRSRI